MGDYNPTDDQSTVTWLRRGPEILRIREIDPAQAELRGLTIFRRDQDGNLTAKIDAARAVAEDGAWMLYDVTRSDVGSATVEVVPRMPWAADLAPGDLAVLVTNPPDMPLYQLVRVIRHPELGSQPAYRYETWLHERLAGPVTTAMLLLLTVALARPPRGRPTQGVLIAIGIGGGFLLWVFDGLVLNFGDLGVVPPILAAWTPVAVIAAVAASVVLHDHGSRRSSRARGHGHGPRPASVAGAP
jgi:lipopolysaccharide export system permease protein